MRYQRMHLTCAHTSNLIAGLKIRRLEHTRSRATADTRKLCLRCWHYQACVLHRPVAAGLSSLVSWPMREMLRRSAGENTASL